MNLFELPQNFQECREYRHPWAPHTVEEAAYLVTETQICPRCGNERFRVLSKRKASYGHVIKRWQMRYREKNYLLKKEDRPTVDDMGVMRMGLIGYER
jgi:hypothetical protein